MSDVLLVRRSNGSQPRNLYECFKETDAVANTLGTTVREHYVVEEQTAKNLLSVSPTPPHIEFYDSFYDFSLEFPFVKENLWLRSRFNPRDEKIEWSLKKKVILDPWLKEEYLQKFEYITDPSQILEELSAVCEVELKTINDCARYQYATMVTRRYFLGGSSDIWLDFNAWSNFGIDAIRHFSLAKLSKPNSAMVTELPHPLCGFHGLGKAMAFIMKYHKESVFYNMQLTCQEEWDLLSMYEKSKATANYSIEYFHVMKRYEPDGLSSSDEDK